ncbi:hypothetical protein TSAR_003467 [Trichomalopsis sarcophagae]|uniref:Uncharacterized protein n=1 Tax=Trichomalopsis sarcophagae TaxID=543379 RepID=A0A232EHF1_9HYME|nr:hypothetical protein TSAR_003467 [Trichomalopsis sarcophagae]
MCLMTSAALQSERRKVLKVQGFCNYKKERRYNPLAMILCSVKLLNDFNLRNHSQKIKDPLNHALELIKRIKEADALYRLLTDNRCKPSSLHLKAIKFRNIPIGYTPEVLTYATALLADYGSDFNSRRSSYSQGAIISKEFDSFTWDWMGDASFANPSHSCKCSRYTATVIVSKFYKIITTLQLLSNCLAILILALVNEHMH